MSESQSVPDLMVALEGAEDKTFEKVAELSFMRALALLGESVASTIQDQSARIDAIRFIAERNQYATMAEQAFQQASATIDATKRAALQLAGNSFAEAARNLEQRFLQQFAQGQTIFADGVRQVFGSIGETGGQLLGPVVGGLLLQSVISDKLDKAIQEGKTPEQAVQIITEESGRFISLQLAHRPKLVLGKPVPCRAVQDRRRPYAARWPGADARERHGGLRAAECRADHAAAELRRFAEPGYRRKLAIKKRPRIVRGRLLDGTVLRAGRSINAPAPVSLPGPVAADHRQDRP